MKIHYTNNAGGGFSGAVDVDEGTTIEQFFKSKFPDAAFTEFDITINKLETWPERVLNEGDRVTIVPSKYAGS